MEVAGFVLLAAFAVVAIASSIVYRDYRSLYAQAHHDDAPFLTYLFEPDRDPVVETARVRSRNTGWLTLALAVLAALVIAQGQSGS